MPPRSAKRKAPSRARNSTPKSEQPVLELEDKDSELLPSEEAFIQGESPPPAEVVQVVEEVVAQPMSEETVIKQGIEQVLNQDFVAVEVSNIVVENEFVEVKEESIAGLIMPEHVNTVKNVGEENNKDDFLNSLRDLDGKYENAIEGEHIVGEIVGSHLEMIPEIYSAEEETTAAESNDLNAPDENNNQLVVKEDIGNNGENISEFVITDDTNNNGETNTELDVEDDNNGEGFGEGSGDDGEHNEDGEEDNEDDENPSLFLHDSLTNGKKDTDLEIYVGRLSKETVEDDLIKIFGKFGELKAARIVRNPTTKKSKGFAFIQFATVDQAKNALSELKDGIEVRGKHVNISASQDKNTLCVGNICKTWKKEEVLQTLKHYGIEHIEELHLPDDPENDGQTRGFALLEFSTHSDAMAAFQRLRKPDAVFGCDKSVKVAFDRTLMHPSEELLSQVKRVYLEGLTKAWNEEKVNEICSQYGEIAQINIFRISSRKRRGFGFITFTSRESALACVEGINSAQIGDGEGKVKASIAKPQCKGRLQKQGFRGGFKVTKESQVSPMRKCGEKATTIESISTKMKGEVKSVMGERARLVYSEQNEKTLSDSKIVKESIPKKNKNSGIGGQTAGTSSRLERTIGKRKRPAKVEGRRDGIIEHTNGKRPSKKPRGNVRGRERNNSRNPKRDSHIRKGQNYSTNSTKYRNPYAQGHATSTAYFRGHGHTASISATTRHSSDMEPHAGFIEPAAGRQVHVHTRYVERTVLAPPHRYIETAVGTQLQPYANYLQPAVLQLSRDPYNSVLRRAAGHADNGSIGSAYGRAGPAVPAAYAPNYASFTGYQGGGGYYQNNGAHPPPRTYY